MTDDELRQYLKPHRPPWLAIGGFVVTLIVALAGGAKWLFTTPTQTDFQSHETRLRAVEQDHGILKANVDGMRSDLGDLKGSMKTLNETLMQLRLTGRR